MAQKDARWSAAEEAGKRAVNEAVAAAQDAYLRLDAGQDASALVSTVNRICSEHREACRDPVLRRVISMEHVWQLNKLSKGVASYVRYVRRKQQAALKPARVKVRATPKRRAHFRSVLVEDEGLS